MTTTIYTGKHGEQYDNRDEALAAVRVHEITAREYGEKFGYISDPEHRLTFLDDGEILDECRDTNGEGGFHISTRGHSLYIDGQMGRNKYPSDYYPVEECEIDEDGDIVSSRTLGYIRG